MIVIVGGGPAGLHAAEHIAAQGAECLVLEEHKEIGLPVQCAGLISRTGLEELGVFDRSYILNEVKGARFFSPNESFSVRRPQPVAEVVSRTLFDQHLGERAEKKGAEIRTGCKVSRIQRQGGKWVLRANEEDVKADFLILACGCNRTLVEQTGLTPYKIEDYMLTAQVEAKCEMDKDLVELYCGRQTAPGFFAWRIPTDETVRIGLGTTQPPKPYFDAFLKKFDCHPVSYSGGLIPIRGPLEKTQGENVLLLGDTAGQVKPTTGGGIVPGLTCAKFAAQAACAAENGQAVEYEKLWRARLGGELSLGLMVHQVNEKLTDAQFDELFRMVKDEGLDKLVETYGHMDKPSSIVSVLKERPGLLLKLARLGLL